MAEAKIWKAQTKRKTYVNQLIRIKQFVDSKLTTASLAEVELRLEALNRCFENFERVQGVLEELDVTEVDSKSRAEVEEYYFHLRPLLTTFVNGNKPQSLFANSNTESLATSASVKLPKVPLPIFSGEYTSWPTFFETFINLVHKNKSLDNISRFHYLRSSLTGSALKRIESIEVTADNYEVALSLLSSRYDRKVIIIQEHIKKLFNLPTAAKGIATSLRNLIDTVQSHLRALKSLGRPVGHWDDLIIYILSLKVDPLSLEKWNDECTVDTMPTLDQFVNFLEKRCNHLEGTVQTKSFDMPKHANIRRDTKESFQSTNLTTSKTSSSCSHCNNLAHSIYQCQLFKNLSPQNRFNIVKQKKLCINCLKSGHSSGSCTSNQKCRMCSATHHTLLHFNRNIDKAPINQGVDPTTVNEVSAVAFHSSKNVVNEGIQKCNTHILLATALVHILNKRGEPIVCRALLDSGAQLHFISKSLAIELGVKTTKVNVPIGGIGNISTIVQSKTYISLKSLTTPFEMHNLEVHILPKISEPQPDKFINIQNWPLPTTIKLADPNFNLPNKIDLLLGAELYCQLLEQGKIQMGSDLPTLQNTQLGWIVTGRANCTAITPTYKYQCNIATKSSITSLEKLIRQFWEIERHDSPSKGMTVKEQQAETHFVSTHMRLASGQFVVRLPFSEDPAQLGESMASAKRRLMTLEKKLSKDTNLKNSYSQFMEEYSEMQHMTELRNIPHHNFVFPHHCVIKPDSSSTKLRVVFDGSAKTNCGKSLNDILLVGPTVQPELFAIILRFRLPQYVFAADISKMYRQILIDPTDRQYQLLLWRNTPDETIKTFQLNTVTYGTSAAPFLATRCLNQLANDEKTNFPDAANSILQNIYVDDCMTGHNDIHQAKLFQSQIIALLKKGNFELRKFCANDKRLLEDIPESHREKYLTIQGHDVVKTLGLVWQPERDVFQFYVPQHKNSELVTKRSVLSDLGRIFDPLGLVGPAVVLGKIYFQQLWKRNFSWDDRLPYDLETRWKKYLDQLQNLNSLQVNRHMLIRNGAVDIQLHAFCDSSEVAYGSACYLRSQDAFGQIYVQLICSKSRVAPTKHTTIPRLELCAALLMAELVEKLITILPIKLKSVTYYSDSKDVLCWISSPSFTWQTFVANRVAKLQDLTRIDQWKYINTKQNPADLISRGVLSNTLVASSLWFTGPEQLRSVSPLGENPAHLSYAEPDEKRHTKLVLTVSSFYDIFQNLHHTSSLTTLERTFAYCYRFIKNCQLSTQNKADRVIGPLTIIEIEAGLRLLIRHVQLVQFNDDYKQLNKGTGLEKSNKIRSLNPFIDRGGLLRVGGRLTNSQIPFDAKHQILLPKNHTLSKTIMAHYHFVNMHAAPQTLLALVRQKYWPIDGKNLARRIVNNCIRCFKTKPRGIDQIMGNLPVDRVTPSRPFAVTGIDFCGPVQIYIRVRGKTPRKAYIAIFVCFSTRAVHLEVVSDLSTSAFLAALKRFIGRRGLCSTIYCDNATNFMGCKNELAALQSVFNSSELKNGLQLLCQTDRITWKPIPPRSPHFGGLWEAAVKSAKHHLVRSIAGAALTFEELNTIIVQIEAILNSRPLTPLSSDPNDLEALTPAHFLIGAPLTSFVEPDLTDIPTNRLTRYRRLEQIKQIFWRRWSTEYLHLLQQRKKWSGKNSNLQIDTLVLVGEDNIPSFKWLLGRIIKLYTGKDGIVRVADVNTKCGVYKRPIIKLYPLPLEDKDKDH